VGHAAKIDPHAVRGKGVDGRDFRIPPTALPFGVARTNVPTQEPPMTATAALWLPILLSAVAVFLASSVIHMATPWHKGDYPAPPRQDELQAAMRPFDLPPGDYMMPRAADMAAMQAPEFQEKLRQGPVLTMTVMPNGPWTMGKSLVQWFVYSLVVSFLAGYVPGRALAAGAEYMLVFQMVSVTAFLGYALALWQGTIWYHRGVGLTLRSTIDGGIYALITGGVFGWLWP
jgi:hypothetical protein